MNRTLRNCVIAALALAASSPAVQAAPKRALAGRLYQYYQARAWDSGIVTRASAVCGDKYDWQAMAGTSADLLDDGMLAILNAHPETVMAWWVWGRQLFDGGVAT
jgi:hypothetical protein